MVSALWTWPCGMLETRNRKLVTECSFSPTRNEPKLLLAALEMSAQYAYAVEPRRRASPAGTHCFSRQRGELRQRYREGQEDQLVAFGLVLNALILLEHAVHGGGPCASAGSGQGDKARGRSALVTPRKQTLQCTRTLPFPPNRFHPKRRTPSTSKARESH